MNVGFLCLRDSIRFRNENRSTLALVAAAATSELLMAINARGVSLRRPLFLCNWARFWVSADSQPELCFGKRRLRLVVRPWDGDAVTENIVLDGSE